MVFVFVQILYVSIQAKGFLLSAIQLPSVICQEFDTPAYVVSTSSLEESISLYSARLMVHGCQR